jgi:hypothetical protein
MADLGPLATDLGAPYGKPGTTQVGQTVSRLNRIAYDVGLLTAALADPSGTRLNPNGSLQKLVTQAELYDNLNRTAAVLREVLESARPVVRNLTSFTERISRDPSVISRGVLDRN